MSYIPSRGLAEFALKVLLDEDRRTAVVRNAMLSGTGCEKRLRAVIFNGLANDRVGRKRIAVQRSRRTQLTEERRVARTTEGPVDILGPASDSSSLIAVEFKAWRAPGLWRGPADEFAALARDVAKLHRIHLARSDVRGVALVVGIKRSSSKLTAMVKEATGAQSVSAASGRLSNGERLSVVTANVPAGFSSTRPSPPGDTGKLAHTPELGYPARRPLPPLVSPLVQAKEDELDRFLVAIEECARTGKGLVKL